MAIDVVTLALSKKYTKDTAEEFGAVKGAPCTVKSVTEIEGGHRVTLEWKNSSNVTQSTYFDVMDGADGNGIYVAYVVGSTPYADDWLSFTASGEPLTPTDGEIYVVISEGDYQNLMFRWDETEDEYISVGGSGSGDASLESAVTSNLAVGAIASGTTLAKGTTFTEFVQKLLISEIAPTTTFTASGSGVKEIGTSVTPTLTLVVNTVGTGTPTAIKFYSGSTLLDTQDYVSGTNTYSFTMTDAITTNTTVKGVLEYTKSDSSSASIEKTAPYTFVMASYYGAVTTAPTDKAGIIALTKVVKNTKAQTATFNLSNQRSCYCYPASFGQLTSIKDANNFEYLASYTKTNVTVDDVSYNVYTLTDPVTATGFKQVYS